MRAERHNAPVLKPRDIMKEWLHVNEDTMDPPNDNARADDCSLLTHYCVGGG